jgi:hypothetical protein
MAFAVKTLRGVLGQGLFGLFGKKKKAETPGQLRPATRDDAMVEAERDKELSRRRGASADRIVGSGASSAGGLGRMISGS